MPPVRLFVTEQIAHAWRTAAKLDERSFADWCRLRCEGSPHAHPPVLTPPTRTETVPVGFNVPAAMLARWRWAAWRHQSTLSAWIRDRCDGRPALAPDAEPPLGWTPPKRA